MVGPSYRGLIPVNARRAVSLMILGFVTCALFSGSLLVTAVEARPTAPGRRFRTSHTVSHSPLRHPTAAVHRHAATVKRPVASHASGRHPAQRLAAVRHSPPQGHRTARVAAARAALPVQRAVPHPRAPRRVAAARPLIVIDPGHGGPDSGAIGVTGTLEKRVTLATALKLKHLLKATHRYRVAMTRKTDVFIPLAGRVAFARAHQASLFISIHANASPDRSAHGATVYVRPRQQGSKVTHLAAQPGNTTGIADALAGPKPPAAPSSAWLQYTMIDNLDDDIQMVDTPAQQAHFYVLGATGIPSVLLEMGFLSNRHDEKLLNTAQYRAVIAAAIRDAIDDYFEELQHPDATKA